MRSFYDIDQQDVIVGIGGDWDTFALQNDSPSAQAAEVTGYPLWDSVEGFETMSYLNALFFAVRRKGIPLNLRYRCDSPKMARLFNMTISPLRENGLRVEHVQIAPGPHMQHQTAVDFSLHYSPKKCSVCCAFLIGDEWVDPFTLPTTVDFPKGVGLCEHCKKEALNAIAQHDTDLHGKVIPFR
ncbi:hypothetical protein E4Z66_09405 [Aliishimia ponticola]|uniref:Uncharacterized protein n=1 Tax=Aliishimia ponticola TaxID=2499833 RepID=A0A4S4NG75_9RHOB|nr:hypothetical protein [Aliishimia ponticola]THH37138.1 hypothetical protein E4Z66_09405 [Aliishimia ponticola]